MIYTKMAASPQKEKLAAITISIPSLHLRPHHRIRLQNHGKYNQEDTYPEGEAHFLQLTKQHSSNGNTIHRLEVVCHIYREGSQFAKGLQLKEEGDDGEYRT